MILLRRKIDSLASPIRRKMIQEAQQLKVSSHFFLRFDFPCLTLDNKRALSVVNRGSDEADEHAPSAKRVKAANNNEEYLRGRLLAVQNENKILKEKIEEMETKWMRKYRFKFLVLMIHQLLLEDKNTA